MYFRDLIPRPIKMYFHRLLYKYSLIVSQAGQDIWIYGEAFNEKKCGYFLDIGAHDGIVYSNTYLLEKKYNWSGILIEANPISFRKLQSNRRGLCLNVALDKTEGEVTFALRGYMGRIIENKINDNGLKKSNSNHIRLKTKSLNYILQKYQAPKIIDYLSIDVEGAEERILIEFNFKKYIFRCVTIERPTNLLRKILRENGYVLIKEIPKLDCFYVHETFLDDYLENLYSFYKKRHLSIRWNREGNKI